jgi:hypothetical protein
MHTFAVPWPVPRSLIPVRSAYASFEKKSEKSDEFIMILLTVGMQKWFPPVGGMLNWSGNTDRSLAGFIP